MKLTAFFNLMLFSASLFSCTDFLLEDSQGNFVDARAMDFGFDLQSEFRLYPKGDRVTSMIENHRPGMSYRTKYNFAGITVFHSNLISDGMNDQGLSVGVLWFFDAKYPKPDAKNAQKTLAFQDLPNWILGCFSNVDEVKEAIPNISVWAHPIEQIGEIPEIHIAVNDRKGKSIVIQFLNHEIKVVDNEVGVLTNNPTIDWHETNLRNYINLTALDNAPMKLDGMVITPLGQGTGLHGIPGDWSSVSRFVRTAITKNYAIMAKNPTDNANLAFHILNLVDVPFGLIRTRSGEHFDYTQWAVVKDLKNLKYHYRTYKDLSIRELDLKKEFVSLGSKVKVIPLEESQPTKMKYKKSRISVWLEHSVTKVKETIFRS